MRDLLVLLFTVSSSFIALFKPWIGVLALAVIGYLNPHRYAWGFSVTMPIYFIVFSATVIGMFLNRKESRAFPLTRETMLFILLMLYFTLTTYLNPDHPFAAQSQWEKVMKIYIGIIPTFFLIRTKEQLKFLLFVIAISFGLVGLKGGIFAIGTGFSHKVWGPPYSFYADNNDIALALNMMLPVFLLCGRISTSKWLRIMFPVMFIFSVFSVICTWSRGGLLTLAVTVSAILLRQKRKRWLLVLIPGLLLAIPVASTHLPTKWFDRMQTIETYDEDASVLGRFEAWNYAYLRANMSPFSGGGFETFRGLAHDAHSAYFEILGEHGYVALLLWLSLLFGTMIALERVNRRAAKSGKDGWIGDAAISVQTSLLAYAVGGAFLGVAYWDLFYHLNAICVLLKILQREEKFAEEKEIQMTREVMQAG
ncbi:MAG: putative O-glycosylation ligase, exosortase A system-associated [Desulfobacterales bacterium]|nr:putative O-glycosylation ligase, exosortase A system-associated [Desulfobacterales bacterium]